MTRTLRVTAPALAAVLAATLLTAPPASAASYPTWDDVLAARSDESATAERISELTTLLDDLRREATTLEALARQRGEELQRTQDAADEATETLRKLTADVARAEAAAAESQSQVARWAASLTRTGGTDLTTAIVASGSGADDLLSRLGTATQVSRTANRMLEEAAVAGNAARALEDQAQVATTERDRLAGLAASARDEAVEAVESARAAVTEQEARSIDLEAQLAVLEQATVSAEEGFAEAEAIRIRAEADAARRAAAARAAAAAASSTAAAPTSSAVSAAGWTMPITSYSSYQAYGMRVHPVLGFVKLHAGADFGASCGTGIYAAAAGTVTYAGAYGGYGNLITITSAGGVSTNYAHMYAGGVQVSVGQTVTAGQRIAEVGSAGLSTGCHLHFELRQGGAATDPVAYLTNRGV